MDKNLKSILKITAYAGIMTAGIIAFLVYMAKQRKKDMKNRMILIARQIECRYSKYPKKNFTEIP